MFADFSDEVVVHLYRTEYKEKPPKTRAEMPADTLFIYKDNLYATLSQELAKAGYDIEIDHVEISAEGDLCIFRQRR